MRRIFNINVAKPAQPPFLGDYFLAALFPAATFGDCVLTREKVATRAE